MTRYALLLGLYFVQGLPFGFQASALGTYLRERGASRTDIGLLGLLSLPWMLKLLLSPAVDRFGSRKAWIAPLEVALAAASIAASILAPGALPSLLCAVFLMNVFAAALDVAVDGLAVDVLRDRELGHGNAIQVVGFKLGMLMGGGLLPALAGDAGMSRVLLAIGALVAISIPLLALYREPKETSSRRHASLADAARALVSEVRLKGAAVVLALAATYKLGESMIDPMFNPFLVDRGFRASEIQLWTGTYGMVGSLLGSLGGGFLASRLGIDRALQFAAWTRALPLLGVVALSIGPADAGATVAITLLEHTMGGLLTTVMFAFMMSRTNPQIGAGHFTLLATVETFGKAVPSVLSGTLVDATSDTLVFALGAVISVLWAVGLPFAIRKSTPPSSTRFRDGAGLPKPSVPGSA